jgi:hypothetical protein
MVRYKGEGRINTSVTISPEFWKLCKQHNISITEAARIGIAIMLAERGIKEYDNRLNIVRKVALFSEKLSETTQELNELKTKLNKIKEENESR